MCNLQGLLRSSNIRVLQQSAHGTTDDDLGSTEIISVGVEPSSACLWAMVNDFLEVDTPEARTFEHHITSRSGSFLSSCAGANSSGAILNRAIQEMESIIGSSGDDGVAAKITSCVATALKAKSSMVRIESAHNEHRALLGVLKHLQREGYDAGMCATATKSCNALRFTPTGGHQYIDALIMEEMPDTLVGKRSSERLIVDVGFCAHFEIARPLPAYQKLIAMLPASIFVGKATLLQRVVRIMSQAARASLESQDMHVPPWRSFSFLLAKWFSPSCTRITSFDEAKHIVFNTSSSTNHIKPSVLAELDYNSDLANLTHPPVNDDCQINGTKSFFLQEDVEKPWCPHPPTNQISINDNDRKDNISSYTKKRRPAYVVSALALAFRETPRRTHMLTECVPASTIGLNNQQLL